MKINQAKQSEVVRHIQDTFSNYVLFFTGEMNIGKTEKNMFGQTTVPKKIPYDTKFFDFFNI